MTTPEEEAHFGKRYGRRSELDLTIRKPESTSVEWSLNATNDILEGIRDAVYTIQLEVRPVNIFRGIMKRMTDLGGTSSLKTLFHENFNPHSAYQKAQELYIKPSKG